MLQRLGFSRRRAALGCAVLVLSSLQLTGTSYARDAPSPEERKVTEAAEALSSGTPTTSAATSPSRPRA